MTTGVFWQPRKGLAGWLLVALGYFLAYTLLDNLNYRRTGVLDENAPLLLNAGLPYILILSFGRRFLPAVLLAPVLSEVLLDQTRLPMGVEVARDCAIGVLACFAQLLLTSRRLAFDPSLATIRTLMILFVVVVLESAGAASITVLARIAMETGSLALKGRMILDSFVAQFLGMVVIAPLGLFFFRRIWLVLKPLDWLIHISAIGLVFALLFVMETNRPFQSFYLLSLPVLWMAVRGGVEAASVGIALTQAGLIVSQRFAPDVQMNVVDLQMRLMVLSILGLVTGVLVVERLRFERQLRRHQEAVARMARIASMSQLASSIAHEINQPLMAAGTYTRLATRAMETTPDRPEAALVPARKAGEQIERAGEVVRRLRALFKLDITLRKALNLLDVVMHARELCQGELAAAAVQCRIRAASVPAMVRADQLQLEQVMVNLIQNAIQATGAGGVLDIEIRAPRDGVVEVVFADNGPGLPQELIDGVPVPFFSTKESGIGVGLALSRTIIESHEGKLRLQNGTTGALITVSLPCLPEGDIANA